MKVGGFTCVNFQKHLVFRLVFPAVMVFVRKNWKTVVCVQKTVVSLIKPSTLGVWYVDLKHSAVDWNYEDHSDSGGEARWRS